MSVNPTFGLLSGAGTQALQSFMSNKNYTDALGTMSQKNSFTGQNCGFDSRSIFSCSAGNDAYKSFELTGLLPGKNSSIYSGGGFGTSLIGNYYNSINNVGLGQGTPTSIFEQRLAYSMGLREVPRAYYPEGNYSDEFSLSLSSDSSKSGSSSYDVFSTKGSGSSTLSLMS